MRRVQAVTFAVRVLVGAMFVVAGATKIGHFNDFAAAIAGFRILPPSAIGPLAVFLPFFEVGLGLYLLLGLFTRAGAIVAGAQLLVYGGAVASAAIRHLPATCGCFGPADRAKADWPHAAGDFALALVCAFLVWRGPGIWALDRRMGNR